MSTAVSPVARTIRTARRRLFLQLMLNRFVGCWSLALLLGLGWLLAEPWLFDAPAAWLKWAVVGGLAGFATLGAIVWAVRGTPSPTATALEVDSRFGLKERITTAITLRPDDANTAAGQAVLSDAAAKANGLVLSSRFPVRLGRLSAALPTLAGCLALAAVFYHPNTARTEDETDPDGKKPGSSANIASTGADGKKPVASVRPKPQDQLDRGNKSDKLKELENDLEKLMEKYAKDPDGEKPEKQREKVTEITALENKIKKFNEEKFEKLARLEQQLRQLDRLNKDEQFGEGPAKEANEALSKGDLKKAKEEVDELRKKAKNKKLDQDEQEKLARQLDQMKSEIEKLSRNKEREEQLKNLIDQAKKEGRDAESLERELDELKRDNAEAGKAMQDLAKSLEKARQAAEKGDLEELARELEQAGQQLDKIEGELQDLEDAQEYLQRLKEERAACKKCQGEGEGKSDKIGEKDDATGEGQASGRRPENKDAKTASEAERIKGLFDPRGKKSYGGTTRGPAFTKKTSGELGPQIQEAVQEAPQAADAQRLPRDARDAVKEYFQNLGGQAPGGNK